MNVRSSSLALLVPEAELQPVCLEDVFCREARAAAKERARATCRSKLAFRSVAAARNWEILRLSRTARGERSIRARPYACPVCGKWHLTTQGKTGARAA